MTYRDVKGTDLTPAEVDANFRDLVLNKAEDSAVIKTINKFDGSELPKDANGLVTLPDVDGVTSVIGLSEYKIKNFLANAIYGVGYITSTGSVSNSNSARYTTNYIKVTPSTVYIKSFGLQASGAYYDINKNRIGSIGTTDSGIDVPFTTPPYCYYIRVNILTTELGSEYVRANTPTYTFGGLGIEEPADIAKPLPSYVDTLKNTYLEKTNLFYIDQFDYSSYILTGNVAILGDSVIAAHAGAVAVADFIYQTGTMNDLSIPAASINGQKSLYNGLTAQVKTDLNYIFIQVGLNDISGTVATAITNYQGLINQINTDSPSAIIVIGAMTPALSSVGSADNIKLLELNDVIMGVGTTVITGVDFRTNVHYGYMSDGNGNLAAKYNSGDNIHPKTNSKKIIAHSWLTVLTS